MMSHLRYLWHHADTQTTELGSALGLGLCWGVWLLLPFNSLGALPVYQPMLRLMPEWAWGVIFGSIGLTQAFAVARPSRRLRFLCAYLALAAWLFILVMFLIGNVVSLGVSFYILFVFGAGWVVWRMDYRGQGLGRTGPGE